MVKIIQNFSSRKHIKDFPIIDIFIGYVGLKQLKRFGHNLKIYCTENDLEFLREWHLLDFYDEIDSSFLSSDPIIEKVNGELFWSIRKLEAIKHEFEISNEPFVYMDVDIIMNEPITLDSDLLVGSPDIADQRMYVPGGYFSKPKGYLMPYFIEKSSYALNCGVIGYKRKEDYMFFYNEYLKFVVDNPCIYNYPEVNPTFLPNLGACNSEQRILAACALQRNLKVSYIMNEQGSGVSPQGIHYYYFRAAGRYVNQGVLKPEVHEFGINVLNDQLSQLFTALDKNELNIFLKVDGLSDLYYFNKKVSKYA